MNSLAASLPLSEPRNIRRASAASAFVGVFRYEFLMQLRRKALWIGYLILGTVLLTVVIGSFVNQVGHSSSAGAPPYSRADILIQWTIGCQFILIPGAGLLLADRTPRDRRSKVIELFWTAPAPTWARLLGKYLGAVVATMLPILVIYLAGVSRLMLTWHNADILPLAPATFLAMVVPPLFFVGAFSIACTTLLWPPLYQFLFIGYWLWTSLNPGAAIPTLDGTLLSPAEGYVVTGFFHFAAYAPVDKGFYPASSVWLGLANIGVLLACAAVALLGAWWVLVRQAQGR